MLYNCKLNRINSENNFDKKNFFLLLRLMKSVPMKLLFIIIAILGSTFCFSAPQPPPPTTPPPPGLPIDSGIILLVIISIIFVYYKLIYKKNASK
jgi:hypothetical protein